MLGQFHFVSPCPPVLASAGDAAARPRPYGKAPVRYTLKVPGSGYPPFPSSCGHLAGSAEHVTPHGGIPTPRGRLHVPRDPISSDEHAALRPLLPLSLVSARNRFGVRAQRDDRGGSRR